MSVRGETSYYLPLGYRVERFRSLLLLRRADGSVAATFGGQQAIGEIVERYAWEDSAGRGGGRLWRVYERFLELPAPVVLGLLWLGGTRRLVRDSALPVADGGGGMSPGRFAPASVYRATRAPLFTELSGRNLYLESSGV